MNKKDGGILWYKNSQIEETLRELNNLTPNVKQPKKKKATTSNGK